MTDSSPQREWPILAVLASVQFTNILDFVIIMPLGPQLMRVLEVTPPQFGLIVSAYTFSAGLTGFFAAFVLDRFDRKKALMVLYAGFIVGTFLCAIAPTYGILVAARVVAGAFGGVLAATVFAFTGDVIHESRRGAAMGTIMSSFSLASIAGVPAGLYLANAFDWHMPFFALAGLSAAVFVVGGRVLPHVRGHLATQHREHPIRSMASLLATPATIRSLTFMMAMMLAGFSVIPYISPYLVANVGLAESDLPLMFFFGGAATFFTSRYIGRLSDRFGKVRVFTWVAALSIVPILTLTNLPFTPVPTAIVITTAFMVLVSGRLVPAMAIVTSSVEPRQRGSFLSLNSSVQQLSAGIAAYGAGLIIGQSPDGLITRYGLVGGMATLMTLVCLYLIRRIPFVEFHPPPDSITEPAKPQ